ncbi:MAG: SAM-dependent methyltransferase [Rickettsiales bacterium]|nr:SAM-dependent methyltransferase [Rickettsiales bacterium]
MSELLNIIKARIAQEGPLTVAEYMEMALGHPEYGYYMHRDPLGQEGDFTTSPEISQIFGELLGAWTAAYWQMSGGGDLALIELGPGRGTLMRDLLRATAHVPGFHDSLLVLLVETSPQLKRMQRALLLGKHSRVAWLPDIEQLPDVRTVFIANEFFDALPVRQYVKTPDGLKERLVTVDEASGELCFTLQELGIKLVKGGSHYGDREIVESSPYARTVATQMSQQIRAHRGAGLVIDYGYVGGSRGNSLQAVKKHGFFPVLKEPGSADLTTHVDFDMLAQVFADAKLDVQGPVSQGEFLLRLGAKMRAETLIERARSDQREDIISGLHRLTAPHEMGELFKVLGICDDHNLTLAGF